MITTPNPSAGVLPFFQAQTSLPVMDSQRGSQGVKDPLSRHRRETSGGAGAVTNTEPSGVAEATSEPAQNAVRSAAGNLRDLQKSMDALIDVYVKSPDVLAKKEMLHPAHLPGYRPYDRAKGFVDYLNEEWIILDPDSDFRLNNEPKAGQTVRLVDFIEGMGWERPTTMSEVRNMIGVVYRRMRSSPPPFGDLGGGLSWPIPLDQSTQRAIYESSSNEMLRSLKHGELPATSNAAVLKLQNTNWSNAELKDPRAALLKLISTPAAQAMGEQLRARFSGAGSAQEWLLSMLQVGANSHSVMNPNEKNKLAGYDLSQPDHWGKPLSAVVKGLTEHLAKTYGRNAPVVAYLLLSHHAPELLVKDVPDTVTYGSPAWVGLKTIVAKANFHAPGSAAGKTYENLARNDLEPVTNAERDVEAFAGREALIHWAVADGAIEKRADNNYTDAELEKARVVSSERYELLKKASDAHREPLLPLKEEALKILKARFSKSHPNVDFEARVLMPTIRHVDLRGPYSILDVYLKPQNVRWYSTDSKVPYEEMHETFRHIPRISQDHEKRVTDCYDALKGATGVAVKHLMSLLPAQDREALEYGELSVFASETTTRTRKFLGKYRSEKSDAGQPIDSRSLLFVAQYGSTKTVYEVNPQQGYIRNRPDLPSDLKPGPRGEWSLGPILRDGRSAEQTSTRPSIREVAAEGGEAQQKRRARDKTPGALQTFTSVRTQYITDTVLDNIFKAGEREELVQKARGVTTFDTEVTEFEEIQAVTRTLIPFASAIDRFQKGKIAEGLGFLAFDVLGFVAGGVFAGAKIAKLGAGLSHKAGGILVRGAISAANPFAGGKAIVSRGLPLWSSAWGKGTSAWRIIAANRGVDRAHNDKKDGITTGTYTNITGDSARITAQLDGVTKKWYGYDQTTKARFGVPLEGFTPDSTGG